MGRKGQIWAEKGSRKGQKGTEMGRKVKRISKIYKKTATKLAVNLRGITEKGREGRKGQKRAENGFKNAKKRRKILMTVKEVTECQTL